MHQIILYFTYFSGDHQHFNNGTFADQEVVVMYRLYRCLKNGRRILHVIVLEIDVNECSS